MQIIEDITYTIEDAINQIKNNYGFVYTETSDTEGYILLGTGMRLDITFNEDHKLESAVLSFPNDSYDLVKSSATSDLYSSGIESAVQIVDLISRMLGGVKSA